MNGDNPENFTLDVAETDRYLKAVSAAIARGRAKTENTVAIILVGALVAALPLYLIGYAINAEAMASLLPIFERWLAVVGPLAGAAVGVGARLKRD